MPGAESLTADQKACVRINTRLPSILAGPGVGEHGANGVRYGHQRDRDAQFLHVRRPDPAGPRSVRHVLPDQVTGRPATDLVPSGPVDVAVLGGGPAGASAARLLSAWGRSVVLLTRPAAAPPLAESLPPSVDRLLDLLGIRAAVEAAGFVRTTGNTVWWDRSEARSESFGDGARGYQVLQSDLERVLLRAAQDAGAVVRTGAVVRRVEGWDGSLAGPRTPARVRYEESGAPCALEARWVLDCTGRAGVIVKQGLRRADGRASTLALVGVWERAGGWGLEEETHTLVESYEDGWAWSVPVSATVRYFTAMVDPRLTALERGGPVDRTYEAELAKTTHLAGLLEGAARTGRPWACTASSYDATRYGGPGFLLVGDAGSFLDPLSSFGVKKALASAWLAAVVTHTCLSTTEMSAASLELFERRERAIYDTYRRRSAAFSREADRAHGHGFWSLRAGQVDELDRSAFTGEPDARELREDPSVLAAFASLKRSPGIRLRAAGTPEYAEEPTVEGNRIVLERRLRVPGWEAGVRHLRGVDLPLLVDMAPGFAQVPDLFEAYRARHEGVTLPDFLGALSVLIARGVLENRFGS